MVKAALFAGTILLGVTGVVTTAGATPAPTHYSNCTQVHTRYPGGIAKPGAHQTGMVTHHAPVVSAALYNANHGLDRDHDGVACEA